MRTCDNFLSVWAVLLLSITFGAYADDEELRALRNQVDELKETTRQLQVRVDALEQRRESSFVPATNSTPQSGPQNGVQNTQITKSTAADSQHVVPDRKQSVDDKIILLRTSWRHVATGMSLEEVAQTLGPPSKEMQINNKLVWYYYYAGVGAGSVFFKSDGHVSGSQPPSFGWSY